MSSFESLEPRGRVFDIQRWSLHDGPGIRTIVFLKGCPLACEWCCNPESQGINPELAYFVDKCIACKRCMSLCPYGAITHTDGVFHTDRIICERNCYRATTGAFVCTAKCYSSARKVIGTPMTVDEVLHEVMKDQGIYEESGGGITVSGGEPMNQVSFVRELLRSSKENYLRTAMETCGFAPWASYQAVLEFVDFMILDIKYLNSELHRQYTGQPNDLILQNAPLIAEYMRQKGGTVIVRTPIVPGMIDPEEVGRIADFVRTRMPGVATLQLMPYHRLGRGKYRDIGRDYELPEIQPPNEEQLRPFREQVASRGLALSY